MPLRSRTTERPAGNLYRRVTWLSIVLVVWMLAIGARLAQLQIAQYDDLAARAKSQQLGAIDTSPTRGQVLDRQGRELARSIDTESFFADPREIQNAAETARRISSVTGLSRDELTARLQDGVETKKKFIWLVRRLDLPTATKLDAMNLDGVYSRKEAKRFYPNDTLAAHVLGFVGTDEIGLGGVEQYYNEKIRGEGGKLYLQRDGSRDRRIFDSYEVQPDPGQTVVLTIDQTIQ